VIRIYADLETLSQAAAELFAQQAKAAIEARGRFSVALAGGKTPQKTYELLARSPLRDRIAWKHVHVFWGDERCVSIEDPRSNALMARTALLDRVPVPPAQIHPIQCAVSPEDAARRYELLLRSFLGPGPPGLDLILLGLGEDGHTASLFPHKPVLAETDRWVAAVYPAEQGLHRVTLTPVIINRAATVVFLVSGASKAEVLREVLEGPQAPLRLPAQLIEPQSNGGESYWLVDRDAASKLKQTGAFCAS
jgi:6-phosphogluconolactonase